MVDRRAPSPVAAARCAARSPLPRSPRGGRCAARCPSRYRSPLITQWSNGPHPAVFLEPPTPEWLAAMQAPSMYKRTGGAFLPGPLQDAAYHSLFARKWHCQWEPRQVVAFMDMLAAARPTAARPIWSRVSDALLDEIPPPVRRGRRWGRA